MFIFFCVCWCGLFPSSVVCHHCSGHCMWVEDGNLDGWIWRCRRKGCQRRRSPRIGTIFEYSELPLSTALQTIYWWSRGLTVQQAVTVVGTSKVTVVEWFYRCRDICANYLLEHHRPIGGIGHVVELDETKIGHRKYNRGRLRDGVWVFGGLDRGTNDVFLQIVEDRSSDTLVPIIQAMVKPGTTIMTDEWRAYTALNDHGFQHLTVNHSIHFVHPETGANTQRMENVWAQAKQKIKQSKGIRHEFLHLYLVEFLWRRKFGGDCAFTTFIDRIVSVFGD